MKQNGKQLLVICLKYALGLGLVVWAFWCHWNIRSPAGEEIGIKSVLLSPIHFLPFLLSSLITLATALFTILRWYCLVRCQGMPITLTSALRLGLIGAYFNTFLPGSVGGDIIKVVLAGLGNRRSMATATVLADRVVGLCGLFWLTALVGGIFWANGSLKEIAPTNAAQNTLMTVVLSAIGLAVGTLSFWGILGRLTTDSVDSIAGRLAVCSRIGPPLASFWRAGWLYRRKTRTVTLALGMTMLSHTGSIIAFYFAACTFFPAQESPGLGAHFLLVPVGMIIRTGFPTPGGLGGHAEFAFGELYALLGFSFASGVIASLTMRAITCVISLAGYVISLHLPSQKL